MKLKLNRSKKVLLYTFMIMALLAGCGNNLSEQNNVSSASPDETMEVTELPNNQEFSESVQIDSTPKIETGNNGGKEIQNTSNSEVTETSVTQAETKTNEKSTKPIYEGLYFDESFYQYVDMPTEESPLVYCEITISNVTDTSFDFEINEKVMSTGESTALVPASTALIEAAGSKAVYRGDGMTLTFSFPDSQDVFPQHLEISGMEKLENKTYINNTISGHEAG